MSWLEEHCVLFRFEFCESKRRLASISDLPSIPPPVSVLFVMYFRKIQDSIFVDGQISALLHYSFLDKVEVELEHLFRLERVEGGIMKAHMYT